MDPLIDLDEDIADTGELQFTFLFFLLIYDIFV